MHGYSVITAEVASEILILQSTLESSNMRLLCSKCYSSSQISLCLKIIIITTLVKQTAKQGICK